MSLTAPDLLRLHRLLTIVRIAHAAQTTVRLSDLDALDLCELIGKVEDEVHARVDRQPSPSVCAGEKDE